MESVRPNIARYMTLHRYFLHAQRNRNLFLAELQGEHPDGPNIPTDQLRGFILSCGMRVSYPS
jgi:hypothetical protein